MWNPYSVWKHGRWLILTLFGLPFLISVWIRQLWFQDKNYYFVRDTPAEFTILESMAPGPSYNHCYLELAHSTHTSSPHYKIVWCFKWQFNKPSTIGLKVKTITESEKDGWIIVLYLKYQCPHLGDHSSGEKLLLEDNKSGENKPISMAEVTVMYSTWNL